MHLIPFCPPLSVDSRRQSGLSPARTRMRALFLLLAALLVACPALPAQSAKESVPNASDTFHRGPTLLPARSARQQAAIEKLLADRQDPASPEFHHWLTTAEIGEQLGNYELAESTTSAFRDVTVSSSGIRSCGVNTTNLCNNRVPGPKSLSRGEAGFEAPQGLAEEAGLGSLEMYGFPDRYSPELTKVTPTVTVVPASSTIGASEPLNVSISVSGPNSYPVPTGTVFLSSGGFTSSATTLSGGQATITVPAGFLALGTDTLAAGYGPDTAGSATYTTASGQANVTVIQGTTPVQAPVFSLPAGSYSAAQTVTITDGTSGATIYYTTNGTAPSTSSPQYTGPITVSTTETIQAFATATGFSNSSVTIATYTITTVSPTGLRFVPVVPCRVADTRNPTGAFGGPELAAESTRTFDIPQSACDIPTTAVAYSLNVTVVPPSKLNYLTLWPAGEAQPVVSTLNSDGRIKANAAITPAGTSGGVSVYVSDATNVILDIDGYFVPASTANSLEFFPLTPCRVADTRLASGALGGPSLAAGTARAFPVLSSACDIPSTAEAYSLNVTAVPHSTLDYLTAWNTGGAQPNVSTLNSSTGAITANAAIVPAGNEGDISIFVSDAADVILDVNGYFAPPATGGLSMYTVTPCRVIDTRNDGGAFIDVLAVDVETSPCLPSSAAQAYVLNATVVPSGALDYLTLWPEGESQPNVSTLNAIDGAVTSNMAIVPTKNGSIDAYASNQTNLILDISSYFAP